ncbi:tryptophan 7-halogenase [Alteromonas ponticola]|uniref:Tryptophan 7-halogenase n=1 Tax=Alteromonas aquimaris TaxID=2998417 RepID=A0ABT3P702_9ALTE|nr:tryptophan halogenase family protein [Alteromonas aquimaris]MCW8108552.1 tryptophan 7-halogenase [Alteromonas aquimaris]
MKVVIVGGGSSGWMAASLLSRLMGNQLQITLIESDQIQTVGVGEATIPAIQHFNRVLGIDERTFLSKTKGSIKLGINFNGWFNADESYMHAFGAIGKDMGLAGFHHTWLKARSLGETKNLWDYSLNFQASKQNKYTTLPTIPNTKMSGLVHAYHLDAGLYAAHLRQLSEASGVKRIEGKVNHVKLEPASGFIESLQLESGEVISGDLFIDCSGFRALLIEGALKTGYEDWRHWLPCDRAIAAGSDRLSPLPPYTSSTAHEAGWQWQIPLQHRTGNGSVYCSDFMDDDTALNNLLNNINSEPLNEPKVIRFITGRRQKQWYKNCVSLGLSSGFIEPLESTSLHLVQAGLVRLVKFFPHKRINAVDVDEYNKQSKIEFERIRDFIILHYYLNNRNGAFWERCRHMDIPDSLASKIALFKESGRVFREQDELFTEIAWIQVMLGQGIVPRQFHPLADSLSDAQRSDLLTSLKQLIDGTVNQLPTHESFLQTMV